MYINLPDKTDMDTETTMCSGTIDAEEDPIGDGGPSWIFGITIETHLKQNAEKDVK